MKKIRIVDLENNERIIYAIRYLKYKNDKLLFYVSNLEKNDIVSIRVSKVKDEVGFTELCGINKKEWTKIRNGIKKIVKELLTNKTKSFINLDIKELVDAKLNSFTILDVKLETFNLLNTSLNEEQSIIKNYKELYEASEKENSINRKLITALTKELAEYKNKYGELD